MNDELEHVVSLWDTMISARAEYHKSMFGPDVVRTLNTYTSAKMRFEEKMAELSSSVK